MKDKLNNLKSNLSNKIWYEKQYQISPYLSEERGNFKGMSKLLVKPRNTKEVSEILDARSPSSHVFTSFC